MCDITPDSAASRSNPQSAEFRENRILIVEDDAPLSEQLQQMLVQTGYRTGIANDGETGLSRALKENFDLVLLDVTLPERDGFSVLRALRQHRQTPVLMLTAHGAEQSRISGLRYGADDYLSKPFNYTELLLRIEAILRRASHAVRNQTLPDTLHWAGLVLSQAKEEVSYQGQSLVLTPVQFRLLWTLVQYSGETLSKPLLYQRVFARDFCRDDRTLDMHISRIRRKLSSAGMTREMIQTVHGIGYRLA